MAELADAPDLGSGARKGVGVRVSLRVLNFIFSNSLSYNRDLIRILLNWLGTIMIEVKKINDTTFEVTVHSRQTTKHSVTVDHEYYQKLTMDSKPVEELVKKSFEFLLERESNTSILRQFDLPVINRYFPEYESVIGKMPES
jgi:hypothetical protein